MAYVIFYRSIWIWKGDKSYAGKNFDGPDLRERSSFERIAYLILCASKMNSPCRGC